MALVISVFLASTLSFAAAQTAQDVKVCLARDTAFDAPYLGTHSLFEGVYQFNKYLYDDPAFPEYTITVNSVQYLLWLEFGRWHIGKLQFNDDPNVQDDDYYVYAFCEGQEGVNKVPECTGKWKFLWDLAHWNKTDDYKYYIDDTFTMKTDQSFCDFSGLIKPFYEQTDSQRSDEIFPNKYLCVKDISDANTPEVETYFRDEVGPLIGAYKNTYNKFKHTLYSDRYYYREPYTIWFDYVGRGWYVGNYNASMVCRQDLETDNTLLHCSAWNEDLDAPQWLNNYIVVDSDCNAAHSIQLYSVIAVVVVLLFKLY